MVIVSVTEEAVSDCLKMLPFLFAAFLIVEWVEHRAGSAFGRLMERAGKAGPIVGSLLGCLPQCGFSVLSSNLYAAGLVSMGTLLSVYLATSDEAVLILLAEPGSLPVVGRLILVKVLIAVAVGYLVYFLTRNSPKKEIHEICTDCGCSEESGILRPALHHTGEIFFFLFLVTWVLDFVLAVGGEDFLGTLVLADSFWQPALTALVGLIPNCAASVLIARLFLEGSVSFAAAVSGLASGAGVGLLVLFRINRNRKEDLQIAGLLYLAAVVSGFLIELAG